MIELNNNIKVYVPYIKGREGVLKVINNKMIKWYGGTTTYDAKGYWMDHNEEVIKDDIVIINSYSNVDIGEIEIQLAELISIIKLDLKQESVTIELNGTMTII